MIRFIELHIEAESLQGFGEVARVVGEEGVGEVGGAVSERGNEQGAVGEGLRTGHADDGVEGMAYWGDAEGWGESGHGGEWKVESE